MQIQCLGDPDGHNRGRFDSTRRLTIFSANEGRMGFAILPTLLRRLFWPVASKSCDVVQLPDAVSARLGRSRCGGVIDGEVVGCQV